MMPWFIVAVYLFLGIMISIIYNYLDNDATSSCFIGVFWPIVVSLAIFCVVFYELPKFIAEWAKTTIRKIKVNKKRKE